MNLDLGDTRLIIEEAKKYKLLRNQLAYVLATAYWETAKTMTPVREYGGEKYLKKKKYYPHVGMGYVQLTWAENYRKVGRILGVDFIKDPKKLLIPKYAVRILVQGMKEGWFTGKKLSDYITLQKSNFRPARRIINGMDKASLFAGTAKQYDNLLKLEGYGKSTSSEARTEVSTTPLVRLDQKKKTAAVGGSIGLLAYAYFENKEIIHDFFSSLFFR